MTPDQQDPRSVLDALRRHRKRLRGRRQAGLEVAIVEEAVLHLHHQPPGRGPVPHHDAGRDRGGAREQGLDDPQREHLAGVSDLAEQLVRGDLGGQARDLHHPVVGGGGGDLVLKSKQRILLASWPYRGIL